jgi:hypothetical protein
MEIANFFWHGEMSNLEKNCIKSFVISGFKVKLWSYTNIELPNVESCDANEVLPKNTILRQELNSKTESAAYLAAFSDYFRYKVVNINKGWWFDTDCYCLRDVSDYKKIRIDKNIISGKQNNVKEDIHHIGCGAFWMNEKTSNKLIMDFEKLVAEANNEIKRFGYFGPEFFTNFIKKYDYYDDILPLESFYSIHWNEADLMIYPDYINEAKEKTRNSFLTHIWTTPFRSKGIDKNNPIEGSFLHYLYNK